MAEAQRDTARRGDYQHLEAPDLLWTGAILADRAQKDRRERPLNKRDFLLDDLIGSGLYDQEAANSFLERLQCYTATCVSVLYDHVVDMKRDVSVIVSTPFGRVLTISLVGCDVVPTYEGAVLVAVGAGSRDQCLEEAC